MIIDLNMISTLLNFGLWVITLKKVFRLSHEPVLIMFKMLKPKSQTDPLTLLKTTKTKMDHKHQLFSAREQVMNVFSWFRYNIAVREQRSFSNRNLWVLHMDLIATLHKSLPIGCGNLSICSPVVFWTKRIM